MKKQIHLLSRLLRVVSILILASICSGCGHKGGLYLPSDEPITEHKV